MIEDGDGCDGVCTRVDDDHLINSCLQNCARRAVVAVERSHYS